MPQSMRERSASPADNAEVLRIMDSDIPHPYVLTALHRIGPEHFNNPQTSDLTIQVLPQRTPGSDPLSQSPHQNGTSNLYHIHNLFLSPQSGLFRELYAALQYNTQTTTPQQRPFATLYVPSPSHFRPLLRFLYIGNETELRDSIRNWDDLRGACANAMALRVRGKCVEILEGRFNELQEEQRRREEEEVTDVAGAVAELSVL
ncbi:hypothetical protein HK097_005264 [Rhizophlyctis rosea]|uniref:BTB domain-containing protein n=1 Tax=Rhizophlyctis rosea TaxID=64517 RepID=A0AAD5X675_9FUNG|nr:hypothetical protein HK097_005264 [Rhizophlyctis rosea]